MIEMERRLASSGDKSSPLETIRRTLTDEFPVTGTQLVPEPSPDRAWSLYARMGWLGGESEGEMSDRGYDLATEALVFRELGRVLAPGPIVASVVAARLAVAVGSADIARSIAMGKTQVGFAQPSTADAQVARRVRGRFQLIDCGRSQLVLVVSQSSLALVATGDATFRTDFDCIDSSVGLAEVEWSERSALAAVTDGKTLVGYGRVLTAAMLVGIAEATRDAAVAWAKERRQFGRPIGAFQAVKHRCADMAVQAEAARALLWYAASHGRESIDGALAIAAKVIAAKAAFANSRANIQIHGARGFSEEFPAHRYLKRSHVLDQIWGDQRALCADLVRSETPNDGSNT